MKQLEADVLVVGAGPAGSVAALNLAVSHRVLLIDRLDKPANRIGESLPPAAGRLLADMGLLDSFLMQGHAVYHGNKATWNGTSTEHHFLRNPDGHGWHLNRAAFDFLLREEARRRGAALLAPASAEDIMPTIGGWHVLMRTVHGQVVVRAAVVIDASGRGALLARKIGAQRERLDRLACMWLYGADQMPQDFGFSQVESCEQGWWYTAPLPEKRRVLAFHTDADLMSPQVRGDKASIWRMASNLPSIGPILLRSDFVARTAPNVTVAHSATLNQAAGPGWLTAGDAAISFDPLSSQGIFNALYTGLASAKAAVRMLEGDPAAALGYRRHLEEIKSAYLRSLSYCYAQEQQWPSSTFWQRRQTDSPISPGT